MKPEPDEKTSVGEAMIVIACLLLFTEAGAMFLMIALMIIGLIFIGPNHVSR